jgi:diketogulonate reductase-like aldo/keto reductase
MRTPTRTLGSTKARIPAIGQGTWNLELADRRAAIRGLRRGIELGMTHIDTAEMYGAGEAERIVGEAIDGRREQVFLASKVLPQNASRRGTIAACEASLERLGVEQLDLYLLHWESAHPLEQTIEAFEELATRGLVRHWGVSNFDADELSRVVEIAGPGRCVCDQVLYHLGERAIEHRLLPRCEELGVTLVGYSPFGQGDVPSEGMRGFEVLQTIAAAYDATPRQVALAFLVRRPSLATIPKAVRLEHVKENAGALTLVLDEPELARIERAFPRGRPKRELPTI